MDLSWEMSVSNSANAIAILPCAGELDERGYCRSTNPRQNSAQPNKHCKVAFIKHVLPKFFNPVCGSGPFEGCFCEGRRSRAGNGAFVVAASTTAGSVSFFFGLPTARMNWLSRIILLAHRLGSLLCLGSMLVGVIKLGATPVPQQENAATTAFIRCLSVGSRMCSLRAF